MNEDHSDSTRAMVMPVYLFWLRLACALSMLPVFLLLWAAIAHRYFYDTAMEGCYDVHWVHLELVDEVFLWSLQVLHYTGLPAESAAILDVDRLGMNLTAVYDGSQIPVRLAYPRYGHQLELLILVG